MKFALPLLLCLVVNACLTAQYQPPLSGPLLITGTFGELRSNHFHGGLDFRAPVGTPVRAVGDGFISRVVVSPGGFGQAVYVHHPDGKRSVYGHLEVLAPAIKDTIRKLQYATESFALDFRPDSTAFPVKAGEVIGGVGNRGYSFGPHLHFEIWDAATESQLNPLSLGFPVADTRRPSVSSVRIFSLAEDGAVTNRTTFPVSTGPLPDTITVSDPLVGIGFQAIDRQNSMPNRNGIYRASLVVDSSSVFSYTYDSIPYAKTAYVNALTDYTDYQRNSNWYYLLYAPTPEAVFWEEAQPASLPGVIDLRSNPVRAVTLVAGDYAGNEAVFTTVLKWEEKTPVQSISPTTYNYFLPRGERSIIDTAGLRLELAADALYTDLRFHYVYLPENSADHLSGVHQLHNSEAPLHGRALLTIPATRTPTDAQRKSAYIGRCNADGSYTSVGGEWISDGRMQTQIRTFGDYAILLDSVPPRIRIRDFRTDLRGRSGFSLLIDDRVGGNLQYHGTVDGEWILLEYDAKSGTLSHTFAGDRIQPGGYHEFRLRVTDGRGNSSTFERNFRR